MLVRIIMALVARPLGDDLHLIRERQGGVGMADAVQPNRRQLLPQRLARLGRPRLE
jgi:hypothetical protein